MNSGQSNTDRRVGIKHGFRAIGAIVLATALSLVGAGCAPTDDGSGGGETKTLVLAQANAPAFGQCEMGSFICDAVYDQLLKSLTSLEHEPNLITEWSYNDDRTVLSATLRDDVVFNDGTPLNPEAVKANMEFMKSDAGDQVFRQGFLASLDHVEVTGDNTLDFVLSRADAWFEWRLGHIGTMMSPDSLKDLDTLRTHPVGTGPYVLDLTRTQDGVEYVLTRNEDYWNPDAYPWDELIVKIIPDATARLNAVIAGEVDLAEIEASAADHAKEEGLDVTTSNDLWQGMVILDVEGKTNPALADQRVREAINMAVNREEVVKNILHGYGEVSNQPFHKNWPYYQADLEDRYPYDPEAARELLAEAGYPDGFDLVIPTNPIPSVTDYMPLVKQSLGDIGIRVTYEEIPDLGTYAGELFGGNGYGVFIFGTTSLGTLDQRFNGEASSMNGFDWISRDATLLGFEEKMRLDISDPETAAEFANYIFDLGITPTWATKSVVWASQPGLVLNHVGVDLAWLRLWEIEEAK